MAPIKTRILIISDTHGLPLAAESAKTIDHGSDSDSDNDWAASSTTPELIFTSAFRTPLPPADVAIHCGDLTKGSGLGEFHTTFSLLASLSAPLKIAIPGNHDVALAPDYWADRYIRWEREGPHKEARKAYPAVARRMIAEVRKEGVHVLVEEGSYDFVLANGARLKIFASPWTPAYGGWPFQYRGRHEFGIPKGVDVAVTHGPPRDVLDRTLFGARAGCKYLLGEIARARPRVHCFGHIHEGWGARLLRWNVRKDEDGKERVSINQDGSFVIEDLKTLEGTGADSMEVRARKRARRNEWAEKRARRVDLATPSTEENEGKGPNDPKRPLEYGKETLFVNAAVVNIDYKPVNLAWLVDLELPSATEEDEELAKKTQAAFEKADQEAESPGVAAGLPELMRSMGLGG